MEPIRILHMIGCLEIGGSQTMVINLYKMMDRSKIQFDFIVDRTDRMQLADTVRSLGARIYTLPSFVGSNIAQVRQAWEAFFTEHPEYKILHSHVRSYASLYLPIAKKHGVKTIIHSHATSNGSGAKALVKKLMQYPLRYQADYFFSCSEQAGLWLFGQKIVAGSRHHILKNAIDAQTYRFDPSVRAAYIQQLNLEGKRVYAHVGRFHPAKNHSFLLRVFRKICDADPNALLLLIGDGELRENIEQEIEALNLRPYVLLLGIRNDVAGVLQAADVFLFPSLWEGLGIVAVEAQAAGLPCICSDQVPPLVKVMDSCCFIPLDEEKWAAAAMSATPDKQDSYDQIVAAGYDVHATAQWLYEFYSKLWRN